MLGLYTYFNMKFFEINGVIRQYTVGYEIYFDLLFIFVILSLLRLSIVNLSIYVISREHKYV